MKTLVIYHHADFDGLFCREIARKFYADKAEYVGWDYGDPLPIVASDVEEIVMLDISVDGMMDDPRLVWIDHHKTAIEKFNPLIAGYRIDGVAACRLAWQYFFTYNVVRNRLAEIDKTLPVKQDFVSRTVREPTAVRLAGEYDIWDKRDPNTDLFQHGLRSCELNWDRLLMSDARPSIAHVEVAVAAGEPVEIQENGDIVPLYISKLLAQGRILEYAREHENASIIKHQSFTVYFEGRRFLALNTARCNSLTFLSGLKPEHEGCLSFNWTGKDWRCSLYGVPGKPEIDFSSIAKKYGGGGHRQACGFKTKSLPFLS